MKVSAIITAAGKNSRMHNDLIKRNLKLTNKLVLPLNNNFDSNNFNYDISKNENINECVISKTINNVLQSSDKIDECIIVLGHYKDEIHNAIVNINDNRVKIIENNPAYVGLSKSLLNGIQNSCNDMILAIAGDQPTIGKITLSNIIDKLEEMNATIMDNTNIDNYNDVRRNFVVLRRLAYGKLDTAKGLGMPFATNGKLLSKYLEKYNDNLNPIIRELFNDGFNFYGIKEENDLELININHYKDYKFILEYIK